ncbi:DUF1564 domain-containing protein [Leptospira gomenensis]|uniref:DUF1564 domain-containing protein n=1 Tax=Leptospira gomenensis TaxID=2484974 RepID=A0A5F1YXL9_9LEPT|nr:DUF1564 domain-containing protein [Leptospira gomenensis]TGK38372.1 DUF1564 domain-containing protein [Leptospira gomenensis]TGK39293.1 DUF1564 domain-containing protein [Leptospira gomenensis]TGK52186.1 DUF1564 domain-containing protein [Leptospira gomenensis]TGK62960.1 DUF1564 domain-containing protein [Leptospira gomenensis]
MDRIFLSSHYVLKSPLNEEKQRMITLLVPESTRTQLSAERQKNLGKNLPHLLRKYAKLISSQNRINEEATCTLYQKNQGRLVKISVRMETKYWNLLGVLASSHGVSRCLLYNYLLTLEEAGVGDFTEKVLGDGVPAFSNIYRYIWHLDTTKNTAQKSLKILPNPMETFFNPKKYFPTEEIFDS